ncbi:MAG: hypothetical protein Q9159_002787 [Coniocarpon cinnabarinum]
MIYKNVLQPIPSGVPDEIQREDEEKTIESHKDDPNMIYVLLQFLCGIEYDVPLDLELAVLDFLRGGSHSMQPSLVPTNLSSRGALPTQPSLDSTRFPG